MNDDELTLTLLRKIEELENRIEYLEAVETLGRWIEYSDTSTITGWSAYTVKEIYYKRVGLLCNVLFHISGTSDAVGAYFTIPFTVTNDPSTANIGHNAIPIADNGAAAIGFCYGNRNTTTIYCSPDADGSNWTNSGTKTVKGGIWVQVQ